MGIRILAVSDMVDAGLAAGLLSGRSADVILACGDLPADYLGALMNDLNAPLVFVPGNHDPDQSGYRQSRSGLVTRAGFPAAAPWPEGAVSADGRVVAAAGLRLAGLGGCLRYSEGPNQYTERQQARRARRLQWQARKDRLLGHGGIDVLLTHAAPRGVGDGDDMPHRGFTCYHSLIAGLAPAALLHGHVHPDGAAAPAQTVGRTTVCNVTGWRLLELTPVSGLTELLGGYRHAV
jgi:calcineurin-like phosphoesterase family protein